MKKENETTTQTIPPAGGDETIPPEGVTLTELKAENEQLKTTIRLNAAHRQITGELLIAGARSPELLFDSVKSHLQFAEDGQIENAAALIAKLKAGFPEQFGYERPASIDGGAGTGSGTTLTREALAKMKPAEIAELDWNDVRRVLAAN
ncbi:MAG: hypothetical protein ACKVQJ_09620 [Pyrinomonadaceae bacterium]